MQPSQIINEALEASESALSVLLDALPIGVPDETTLRYARCHVHEALLQLEYCELALENR